MSAIIDTVLLLALPASGKSEIRRYLSLVPPHRRQEEFGVGDTVQLDDFPYVHLMRSIDDALEDLGKSRMFFSAGDKPFENPADWGTLVQLVNEDYSDLLERRAEESGPAARRLMDRLDRAAERVGIAPRLAALEEPLRGKLAERIEGLADGLLRDKFDAYPDRLDDKTIVVEFARGGPQGSTLPLPEPYGYGHSLSLLSKEILERASILYVWVTPEESRRKNDARADPDDPGSILHHGVPLSVMLNDYGCDDMEWLEEHSDQPGTVSVEAHGQRFHLPLARFDNREDKTSFVRENRESWPEEAVDALHAELRKAFGTLLSRNAPVR
jgi:hypothetical protein